MDTIYFSNKIDYSQSIPEALTYLFEQYESQPSSEQFSFATLGLDYDLLLISRTK
jgi:hypothetical protein